MVCGNPAAAKEKCWSEVPSKMGAKEGRWALSPCSGGEAKGRWGCASGQLSQGNPISPKNTAAGPGESLQNVWGLHEEVSYVVFILSCTRTRSCPQVDCLAGV